MGINRGTARLLLEEARQRPFGGSVLELGKMFVFCGPGEVQNWAAEQGVGLDLEVAAAPSHDPDLAAAGCMDDVSFFRQLGFSEVHSLDANRWEGADLVHDLNLPLPDGLAEQFDVVFEGGTIQHVFHLPQVLANIHKALRPGGRVIHGLAPSHNHVDHGFYMFSPTLFFDWYTANGWRIESCYLCQFVPYWLRGRMDSGSVRVYRYEPGCLDDLSYGRMGNRQLGLFVVATKIEGARGDVVPQQGYYRDFWQQQGEESDNSRSEAAKDDSAAVEARPAGSAMASQRELPPTQRALDPLIRPYKLVRELARRFGPKRLPPEVFRF